MHGTPDNDFDKFFKKSVEKPGIKFNPEHWEKLEKRLKEVEIKRLNYRRGLITMLAVAILITSFMVWLYQDNRSQKSEGLQKTEQMEQERAATHADGIKAPSVDSDNPLVQEHINNNKLGVLSNEHTVTSEEKLKVKASGLNRQTFSTENQSEEGKKGNHDNAISYNEERNFTLALEEGRTSSDISKLDGLGPYLVGFGQPHFKNVNLSNPVYFSQENKQSPKLLSNRISRFSVSIVGAPSLSSVSFSNVTSVGFDIGVTTEFHFTKKLSLVTGVIFSSKNYEADKGYKPKSDYFKMDNVKIDHVDGRCDVLDIPINLRYYFISSKHHLFFLSSGFSSYLMLNEDYNIYYNNSKGERINRQRRLSYENKHFFGIMNLSFGYEGVLSERFSFQVEPYVKLPITEIGYGNIDLTSTGAFISLKYRIRNF